MEGFRAASHAGSWYSSNRVELDRQLTSWLSSCELCHSKARAIIGPHAGYRYSGPTAAWSYFHVDTSRSKRVFLFGPSHHFYLQGCALPCSSSYRTPLGDIPIDSQVVESLSRTQKFQRLNKSQEEEEHSLEMHLPYIRKVFQNKEITLVPVMVGQMDDENEYGRIFAEFFRNDENLFIVSSDFCHWGQRFGYTPYDRSKGEVWQSIEKMDKEAMDLIERHDLLGFKSYLSRTRNTICGRNPIILLLSTILAANQEVTTKFVKYDQSERVVDPSSSSVSYASSVSSVN
jgi:AmmeMemoRadiSam system protein B